MTFKSITKMDCKYLQLRDGGHVTVKCWYANHHNHLLLTFMEGREEDPEFALSASFISPQSHYAHRGRQHDIIGHRGAKLIFQVLD